MIKKYNKLINISWIILCAMLLIVISSLFMSVDSKTPLSGLNASNESGILQVPLILYFAFVIVVPDVSYKKSGVVYPHSLHFRMV